MQQECIAQSTCKGGWLQVRRVGSAADSEASFRTKAVEKVLQMACDLRDYGADITVANAEGRCPVTAAIAAPELDVAGTLIMVFNSSPGNFHKVTALAQAAMLPP